MDKAVLDEKETWCKMNTEFPLIIMGEGKHGLSGYQLAILLYIVGRYNKQCNTYQGQTECAVSYTDIQKCGGGSTRNAQKAISVLLERKYIIRTNEDERRGRAKSSYKPNAKLLNNIAARYYKSKENDNSP